MTEDAIWIDAVLGMGVLDSPSLYPNEFESFEYQSALSPNLDDDTVKFSDIQNNDVLNEATQVIIRKQSIVDDLKKGLYVYNNQNNNLIESSNYLLVENSNIDTSIDILNFEQVNNFKRKYEESEESDEDSYQTENSNDTMDTSAGNTQCSQYRMSTKRVRSDSQESKNLSTFNKKQSNKEAAIRYRQKKLKEKEELFNTRLALEKENTSLKSKIDDIQTEINFVKNLLVEMFVKKNLFANNNA